MLFHEFGEDFILALELGFELLDLAFLAIIEGLGLAAVFENDMAVFEEVLKPTIELGEMNLEFIAQISDRDLVDEMPFEDGDFLGAGQVTTMRVHDETSVQVRLTQTERFSRFD
jgi:hypothetical protein